MRKNTKGSITIETIIVLVIILTAGIVGLYFFNEKLNDSKKELSNNVEEKYEDKSLVVNITEKENEEDLSNDDNSDILLTDSEDQQELVNLSFSLPLNQEQNRETVITLENLKEIASIRANNGGHVEVVRINGDKVTIKVTGGDIRERLVVSGQYIAAQTKYVTKQTSQTYSDENGYVGTLTKYLDSYAPAYSKNVSMSPTNLTNSFPSTILYVENDLTTTLSKNGPSVMNVIKGSASVSKTVTEQPTASYTETIEDNGVTTKYTGTLTLYVYSGEASKVKTSTISQSNTTNLFSTTMTYQDGDYSGTLSKSGSSTSVVTKGSPSASKIVTGQEKQNYSETVSDNGKTTVYTGTLTSYVYQGSANQSKTVTVSKGNKEVTEFENTLDYSEIVTDNGLIANYTGTLNKSGSPVSSVTTGSASASKTVTAQTVSNYNETINDNGITTTYTGTLSGYVYQGSDVKTKTATGSRISTLNSFDSTIPYREYLNDNGISTTYSGTLSKVGNPTTTVRAGSNSSSKTVSGQSSTYYSEYVNDNGVGTYYTGTLSSYVSSGSASKSKTATGSRTSTSNSFDSTIPYSEYVNDNGVGTYYSGNLSKSGSATSYVTKGSVQTTKSVSGQSSQSYSEYISNDNGVSTYWTGTLATKTVIKGSAAGNVNISGSEYCYNTITYTYKNKVITKVSSSISGTNSPSTACSQKYPNGMPIYGYTYNDNGVSVYLGTVYLSRANTTYDRRCGSTVTFTYEATCTEQWTANYVGGTVYKSQDTRVYTYSGNVTKPDTRQYSYTQNYSGTVSKPDTRVYRYQGTVTKPDTRLYNYTQSYSGTVSKPDTRVYRYQGTVTKPDTREYGYTQSYSGTVTKPDTRVYRYQGTVTKPDTREYLYTQNYTGTTYTPDTRVYKYQGIVTKPDTRVYEYTQKYTGILNVPEEAIYMYQGNIVKPSSDNRVFDYLYQYDISVKYYK